MKNALKMVGGKYRKGRRFSLKRFYLFAEKAGGKLPYRDGYFPNGTGEKAAFSEEENNHSSYKISGK